MKAAYVKSLIHTIKRLEEEGISYTFVSEYSSFVPHAREATILANRSAGEKKSDYLDSPILQGITYNKIFWIDSDISWTPDDFMKLYRSEHKIISGVYAATLDGDLCVFYEGEDSMPRFHKKKNFLGFIPEGEEVVSIFTAGFGFLCVAAGVFESMERPYFNIESVSWHGVSTSVGEDFSWCIKAKRAGYEIMCDRSVKVQHHKEIGYVL
jgi:hypothetical protein